MKSLGKFFEILGGILAVLTTMAIAVFCINMKFNFLPADLVLQLYGYIWGYAAPISLIITGIGFTMRRNFVLFLFFLLIAAVVVIFNYFPEIIPF